MAGIKTWRGCEGILYVVVMALTTDIAAQTMSQLPETFRAQVNATWQDGMYPPSGPIHSSVFNLFQGVHESRSGFSLFPFRVKMQFDVGHNMYPGRTNSKAPQVLIHAAQNSSDNSGITYAIEQLSDVEQTSCAITVDATQNSVDDVLSSLRELFKQATFVEFIVCPPPSDPVRCSVWDSVGMYKSRMWMQRDSGVPVTVQYYSWKNPDGPKVNYTFLGFDSNFQDTWAEPSKEFDPPQYSLPVGAKLRCIRTAVYLYVKKMVLYRSYVISIDANGVRKFQAGYVFPIHCRLDTLRNASTKLAKSAEEWGNYDTYLAMQNDSACSSFQYQTRQGSVIQCNPNCGTTFPSTSMCAVRDAYFGTGGQPIPFWGYKNCASATPPPPMPKPSTCSCIQKPQCPTGQHASQTGNCGNHGQYPLYCCGALQAATQPARCLQYSTTSTCQAYVLLRPTADGRLEPVQIAGPPCSKIDVTAWSPDFSDGWSAPEENAVFRAPKFCT